MARKAPDASRMRGDARDVSITLDAATYFVVKELATKRQNNGSISAVMRDMIRSALVGYRKNGGLTPGLFDRWEQSDPEAAAEYAAKYGRPQKSPTTAPGPLLLHPVQRRVLPAAAEPVVPDPFAGWDD